MIPIKEILLRTLVVAYGLTGVLSVYAYWPTVRDLYFRKKPSANVSSYILWSFSSGIAFLYSIFILSDLLLRIMSGLGFLACTTILILSIRLGISKR
jgi:hypothetical protein